MVNGFICDTMAMHQSAKWRLDLFHEFAFYFTLAFAFRLMPFSKHFPFRVGVMPLCSTLTLLLQTTGMIYHCGVTNRSISSYS